MDVKEQKTTKYANGKIYSIRSKNKPSLIYIGSTCQRLSKRFYEHNNDYKRRLAGKTSHVIRSIYVLEEGDAYIELIENFPCNSMEELRKREGEIMRSYAYGNEYDCVNCNIILDKKEREEEKQERDKIRAEKNAEREAQRNLDIIYNEKCRVEREALAKYRKSNPIIECHCCGAEMKYNCFYGHKKTQKYFRNNEIYNFIHS